MKTFFTAIVLTFIVLIRTLVIFDSVNAAIPDSATKPLQSVTKMIDPCVFGNEAQLASVITAGLGNYFPIKQSKDGDHVTISNVRLINVRCPNLHVNLAADIRYQKTQGFPQFSSSGSVRLASPVIARVTHTFANPQVVQRALACLTDINVFDLNLKNVPNWLDNTWVRQWLNSQLANRMCFDVTSQVSFYVQQGGKL